MHIVGGLGGGSPFPFAFRCAMGGPALGHSVLKNCYSLFWAFYAEVDIAQLMLAYFFAFRCAMGGPALGHSEW
ncbi:unnamed protein product [Amoebophrya sp. A25]|nr:unnamed protein product [Amoebophrya sp. A25]|eukprot:GSA25T00014537001.1